MALKNIVLTVSILLFFGIENKHQSLKSQNLVPNSSFEVFEDCPSALTKEPRFNLIPHWTMPTMGTSDYFNSCSYNAGVPRNSMGYLRAHKGNAYAGLIARLHFDTRIENITREYLQVILKNRLIKGQRYYIELFYALANESQYSIDKIGACLVNRIIDSSDYIGNLPMEPQLETIQGVYKTSKDGWSELSGFYTATGEETVLIIGNFRDNQNTGWNLNPGGKQSIAYYYIDAITLTPAFDNPEFDFKYQQKMAHLSTSPKEVFVTNPEQSYFSNTWYVFNDIYFGFDTYEINSNSYNELDEIIKIMIINADLNIIISGHADSVGTAAYNQHLSEQRAKAIADYIIKNGIPEKRVDYLGYGDTKPLPETINQKKYNENRRVEFMFY